MKSFINLSHSLGPYWKRPSLQVFFYDFHKIFQNSYSLESWWTAASEEIGCKTKTEWKGSIDHKNTITFKLRNIGDAEMSFLPIVPI